MKTITTLIAFTALAGATGLAHAQSDFYRNVTPPNVREGGVAGAAIVMGREYQGSDESRARVLPNIEYQWSNGFFAGALNGIGYNASTQPDMAYGVRVTADFGRKERRSDALRGLGDVDARPELGAFFNFSPTQGVTWTSSVRYGSGNERKGLLVDLGAGWSTRLTPHLRFGTSVATTWSNADHAQSYFGVDALQAVRSGYTPFAPGSGLRDVRLGASLIYQVAPTWSLVGSITYSELLGDAKRSPIVRDKNALSAVVALGYSF